MNTRTFTLVVIAILIVGGIALLAFHRPAQAPVMELSVATSSEPIAVNSPAAFRYEIVDTEAKRELGLGGRDDIPSDYGMLFVFDSPKQYGFWMKGMQTSIDMIWLADDGTILSIDEAVSPDTYPKPFYPPSPVRLVLETRAGEARAQGWEVGTKLDLPL